jgi:protein SCO1/2
VKTLGIALAALLGLAVLVGAVVLATRGSGSVSSGEDPFRGSEAVQGIQLPAFALRDHLGRPLRSSELAGRVTLLTFLDSQCTESCPVIASVLARGIDALSADERERVVAVAVSTDPREDTRGSVDDFLRARHALGRLRFLVAPQAELQRLWKVFQILSSVESGSDSLHSAPVRIYGADGTWLATLHAGADLTHVNLLHDLRVALSRE